MRNERDVIIKKRWIASGEIATEPSAPRNDTRVSLCVKAAGVIMRAKPVIISAASRLTP